MEDFLQQALSILDKNGIDMERLALTSISGIPPVPRYILKYARDHEYGSIVMGRRGSGKSRFVGNVSRGLIQKAEEMAVWLLP